MCTIVQIVYSQINIYKKVTPIWPLLPVQTGSQSLLLKQIISQQPQEVNSQFLHYCTDRLFSKKYLQKGDPNLTFTSCPNRKPKFTIKTNHISTTARGKFTIFTPLYRSLIVKKYLQKVTPIWPLLPVQTGSQSLLLKQIISQQPQKLNSQFSHLCTDR